MKLNFHIEYVCSILVSILAHSKQAPDGFCEAQPDCKTATTCSLWNCHSNF